MTGHTTPNEQRARDAVRALPDPPAREEFRARLRAEFVAGRIPESAAPRRAVVIPMPLRAALALAAAVAGVFLVLGRAPEWQVMAVPASGEVRVDGRPFPVADVAAWREALEPGARVAWSGGEPLSLALPKTLAVQLMPDAELTLPAAGTSRTEALRIDVARGAMQVATGPAFAGRRLVVHTDPVDVEVTGTTFAVIRMPDFACVCVLEGSVRLHTADGGQLPVDAGSRRVVHDDGTVDSFGEVAADEIPVLERFRDEASSFLGARRERP